MQKTFARAALTAMLLGGTAMLATAPISAATAQTSKAKTGTLRNNLRSVLVDAQKLNDAKDYANALAKVKDIDAMITDKTPFEELTVAQFLATICIGLQDYSCVAQAYDRELATDQLDGPQKAQALGIAMTLSLEASKNYKKVIDYGTQLKAMGPLSDNAALSLVEAYYFDNDFKNALTEGQTLLTKQMADPAAKIDINLFEIVKSAQAKNGDTSGAIKTLEQEALYTNASSAWSQITNSAFAQKGLTDHLSLQIYRLRVATNTMNGSDWTEMARADLKLGINKEAQTAISKGSVKGAEFSGTDGKVANEQKTVIPGLEKAAASNGDIGVTLGETYWTYGRLPEAEAAIKAGIAKGGVKSPGDAQIMLGIVLLDQGKKDEAIAAFKAAEAAGGAAGAIGHLWGVYAQAKGKPA